MADKSEEEGPSPVRGEAERLDKAPPPGADDGEVDKTPTGLGKVENGEKADCKPLGVRIKQEPSDDIKVSRCGSSAGRHAALLASLLFRFSELHL